MASQCRKCGGVLSPSAKECPRCEPQVRFSGAARRTSDAASEQLETMNKRLGRSGPGRTTEGSPSVLPGREQAITAINGAGREKVLCTRCMDSFPDVSMYDLAGKKYCERCFRIVVGEKHAPDLGRVEMAAPSTSRARRDRVLVVLFRILCLALVVGFILATVWILRHKPKWALVKEFDGVPAFRPTVPGGSSPGGHRPGPGPAVSPGSPGGVKHRSSEGEGRTPGSPPLPDEAMVLPIAKGTVLIGCPACNSKFSLLQRGEKVKCPNCLREIRLKEYDILPALKYMGRETEGAILRLGGQQRCVSVGKEVAPDTGIFFERFLPAGVFLVKTDTVKFWDRSTSPPQEFEKRVRLEKSIPKCHDDETTDVTVVQGAPRIICNGRGTKEVYHSNFVEIPIESSEPGQLVAECPIASCWKAFRVAVRPAAPIVLSVSPDVTEIACPNCGFVRHLSMAVSGSRFACLNCKRAVELVVVPLTGVRFLGIEGERAVFEHKGEPVGIAVGKELWPGAGLTLASILPDGRVRVRRLQTVALTDYRSLRPSERKVELPITWTLEKAGLGK